MPRLDVDQPGRAARNDVAAEAHASVSLAEPRAVPGDEGRRIEEDAVGGELGGARGDVGPAAHRVRRRRDEAERAGQAGREELGDHQRADRVRSRGPGLAVKCPEPVGGGELGARDRGVLDEVGTGLGGRPGDPDVQGGALDGDDQRLRPAVGGAGETGHAARADEPAVLRPASLARRQHVLEHTHALEVDLRTGADRVAAELVAWESLLLEQEDPLALAREIEGARRAGRTCAHYADVVRAGETRHGSSLHQVRGLRKALAAGPVPITRAW